MKKSKKIMAAMAAATMVITSLAITPFSASAATKNYYDTYRLYVDLDPASGMQQSYVVITHRRGLFKLDREVKGNVAGDIRNYGGAGDTWANAVHYFDATADVTDGGTLYRQNFCTNYDITNFNTIKDLEEILYISTNETKNASGNIITPNPVTVSAVLVGDINNDKVVNWLDVTALNNHLSGKTVLTNNPLRSADTNNDGYVNNADLSMLIDYASGNIQNFLMN